MKVVSLYHLIITFSTIVKVNSILLGKNCTDAQNYSGTCELLKNCNHIRHLKDNERNYTICGFTNEGKEVVCCTKRNTRIKTTVIPSRKLITECEKYKRELFGIDLLYSILTPFSRRVEGYIPKCSEFTFPLVVDGENAQPKEFPHMALLGCAPENGQRIWVCGGSLISKRHVLTAAHCMEATVCPKITVVRLGDLDIKSVEDDARHRDFEVENIIIHPQYKGTFAYNDIAIIKLKADVTFSFYIRPACLPAIDYTNGSELIITGWGSKIFAGPNVAHLQKAVIQHFDVDECEKFFAEEENSKLPDGLNKVTQFCAGSRNSRRDTCQGDSGGPLQIVHPKYVCMYSIIGISSIGLSCGVLGIPGIYTRVFNYNDWIETIVWE